VNYKEGVRHRDRGRPITLPRSDNVGRHSQLISVGKVIRNGDTGASRSRLLPQDLKAVATGRITSELRMIIGHDS
jgi:hypothetical protein